MGCGNSSVVFPCLHRWTFPEYGAGTIALLEGGYELPQPLFFVAHVSCDQGDVSQSHLNGIGLCMKDQADRLLEMVSEN